MLSPLNLYHQALVLPDTAFAAATVRVVLLEQETRHQGRVPRLLQFLEGLGDSRVTEV